MNVNREIHDGGAFFQRMPAGGTAYRIPQPDVPVVYKGRSVRLGLKLYRIDDATCERWMWNEYIDYDGKTPVLARRIGIGIRIGSRCLSIYWGRA